MKFAPLSLIALALPLVTPLFAGSKESAFLARDLLGPDVWTRVVKIESDPAEDGRYPAEFHGLVIAFADILWFYNEYDGTQNLSTRRGQLAADRANLGQLLRSVDPALTGFAEDNEPPPPGAMPQVLPNACFVACLKRWEALQQSQHPPKRARLIACFPPEIRQGHMILEYRRGMRRFIFDPDRPTEQITIPFWVSGNPLTIAKRALRERWLTGPIQATAVEVGPPAPITGPSSKNLIAADPRSDRPRL